MEKPSPPPAGFMGALRALADGLFSGVHQRLELFSTELQEEKFRLIQILFWISAAVFAGVMAITFATLTLVYLLWERARLAALGGLALFYAVLLLAVVLAFRRYLARQPAPFAATLGELDDDRACIRTPN